MPNITWRGVNVQCKLYLKKEKKKKSLCITVCAVKTLHSVWKGTPTKEIHRTNNCERKRKVECKPTAGEHTEPLSVCKGRKQHIIILGKYVVFKVYCQVYL